MLKQEIRDMHNIVANVILSREGRFRRPEIMSDAQPLPVLFIKRGGGGALIWGLFR